MNKRQQVRNERALQDLIKTVPGNDRCADCGTKNPGWASWSLGVFLCIRCAALHRKLGTHISKVKSLSMDSWTNDQVENMKRTGNTASNRTYNPRGTKAVLPIDADEVEGVMERFIRQKYEHRAFSNDSSAGSRQNTGSTSSDDRPPPLPPKPKSRFHFPSFRAASSTYPVRSNTLSPPASPGLNGFGSEPSPPPKDKKPAKFLGAEVGGSRDDGFDRKLDYLRDMGFPDERRNQQVLKGLHGNVEKAVEALIRLGEGSRDPSRTHSPLPPSPLHSADGPVNGITVEKTRGPPAANKSNNPFDLADIHKSLPPPPQPRQVRQPQGDAFGNRTVSPPNAFNPFLQPDQQQQVQQPQQQSAFDQTFENIQNQQQQQQQQQPQVQTQPLFPNNTGGYGTQGPQQSNPFMQQYAPPVPQIPSQYNQFTAPTPFAPPQQQFIQPQPTGQAPNPFLRTSRSQVFNSSNAFDNQSSFNSNGAQQIFTSPAPSQPVTTFAQQQSLHQQSSYNPFQQSAAPQSSPFQPVTQNQQSPFQPFSATQQQQQEQSHQQQQQVFQEPSQIQQPSIFQEPSQMPQPSIFQQPSQIQQQPFHQSTPISQQPFQPSMSAPPQQQQLFQPPASAPPQQQQLFQPPAPTNGSLQHTTTFPIRHDKSSILALYSYPQLAPAPVNLGNNVQENAQAAGTMSPGVQKRSVTMPVLNNTNQVPGTLNPFASLAVGGGGQANGAAGLGGGGAGSAAANGFNRQHHHVSNESVDFGGGALMNGRHSPDAFAGLSARLR